MIFCMLSTQSKEEREGEKRKVISGQTSSNHNTRVIQGEKDESNDVVEAPLQPSELAASIAQSWQSG